MVRDIIEIDEELCVGCGSCVPNCHQGALEVIDGKVRLLSDLMCEGLGACVGHCPTGAMKVERREAPPYDEALVMETIIKGGPNVIAAHLAHLERHNQDDYLAQAHAILAERGIALPGQSSGQHTHPQPVQTPPRPQTIHLATQVGGHTSHTMDSAHGHGGGCPGSRARSLARPEQGAGSDASPVGTGSRLSQWPVQLHLLHPGAPYLQGADLLLAADCSAYALGGFHDRYLKGRALAIACPKLDDGQDSYVQKLTAMIDHSRINTLTVIIMEVPCCRGLLAIAQTALAQASRKVPLKKIVVSIEGEVLEETWV